MKFVRYCLAATVALAASSAFSLPDDRSQPVQIQADSAERDAKTGVTTYTGNVDIHQGSIHIAAGTVVLNSENDELTVITATGSPATYTQQLSGEEDKVDAQASKIRYDVAKDMIVLQGNGKLKQKGASIAGEHIEYDVKAENVKARAAKPGSGDNNQRITVILPPSKKKTAAPAGEAAAQ